MRAFVTGGVLALLCCGCSIKQETPDPSSGCNDVLMDLTIGRADGNPLGTEQMIIDIDVSTNLGEEAFRCEASLAEGERCQLVTVTPGVAFLAKPDIAADASEITVQFTSRPTSMNVNVAIEGSTSIGNQSFPDTTADDTNCPNHYTWAIQ